jgi:protocatechuate 3,4-dioxygenase beta subunit
MTREDAPGHQGHDHDRGLLFDMQRLVGRRRALGILGGTALAALAGCSSDGAGTTAVTSSSTSSSPSSAGSTTAGDTEASVDVDVIPGETAGPFPADGSNRPNILIQSGVVRSDIRSSFGSSTTTAEGVPLTLELVVLEAAGDTPVEGAAVYVWHCNREAQYSLYDRGAADENYLRGVQPTAADGSVTFTTVFPGCYAGRWPHVHFEIYRSLSEATAAGRILATSQLAFPEDACSAVYATSGYEQSVRNLSRVSLATDGVFSDDGGVRQLARMSGDVSSGYTAELVVGI